MLVTDGGPPFNSEHFVTFFKKQGVVVMKSPAYHPQSNGQAERMVRLVKDGLKKFLLDPEIRKLDMEEQIYYFLMNYRNICLGSDNDFPSERLLSYKPKTTLDLINPKHSFKYNLTKSEDCQNACSTNTENTYSTLTHLRKGDLLYYKNPYKTDIRQWLPAAYLTHISRNVLQINLSGRIVSAHRRQLKIPVDSRRRRSQRLIFCGESPSTSAQLCSSNNSSFDKESDDDADRHGKKRKRAAEDDSDSDFFGFAADSLLFERGQESLWNPLSNQDGEEPGQPEDVGATASQAGEGEPVPEGNVRISQQEVNHRRSKRKTKKRRKDDYEYY